jgi:hypothetical protein
MKRTALIVSLVVLSVSVFLVGQLFPPGRKPYSSDMRALRARFNGDAGKARLLLLLSPT